MSAFVSVVEFYENDDPGVVVCQTITKEDADDFIRECGAPLLAYLVVEDETLELNDWVNRRGELVRRL